MTARARLGILATILAAAASGCGQQGPLVLPQDARPVERIDPPAPAAETQQTEDEDADER